MSITENYDLPRIRADLAKCEQRIAQAEGGGSKIPAGFAHVDASQAQRNQLNARYADLKRLHGEYINAMLATGAWNGSEVIERMEAEPVNGAFNDLPSRSIHAHISTARRHLGRCNDDKAVEHLVAALQLIRNRQASAAAKPEKYKGSES